MDIRQVLRRNFLRLRRERGISQIALAETVRTSQARITDIERGAANPTIATLLRLAMALGVEPCELITLDDLERNQLKSNNIDYPV